MLFDPVALPFDLAGGCAVVDLNEQGCFFLTAGYRSAAFGSGSASGVLCYTKCNPGESVEVESVELSGIDPLGMVWDRSTATIFLADGFSNSLLAASWSGGSQALPVTFTPVVTSTEAPVLGDRLIRLGFSVTGDIIIRNERGIGSRIRFGVAGPEVSAFDARTPSQAPSPYWHVQRSRKVPHDQPVLLEMKGADQPTAFDVVLKNALGVDVTVATGTHSGSSNATIPVLPEFFDFPGYPFQVRGGDLRPTTFRPGVGYGGSVDSTSVAWQTSIDLNPEACFVGVQRFFGPHADLSIDVGVDTTLDAFLLVGLRIGGVDPIVDAPGGQKTILSPLVIPFNIDIFAGESDYTIRQRFDVPDQPGLAGAVFSFQILVADPAGGVAYTDIRTTAVLPSSAAPAPLSSGSTAAASAPASAPLGVQQFRTTVRTPQRMADCADCARTELGLHCPTEEQAACQALVQALIFGNQ